MILDTVEVVRVDRLSPSFVRFELGGACLAEFGVEGPTYDQRIKLVFPGVPGGPVPSFEAVDDSWWDTWVSRPEEERGHMRTYTVRDVKGEGDDTRLVVDIVVHPDEHGEVGPGCDWAARAGIGDRLVVIAPRRGHEYGGIEFRPGAANRLLLAGDETAVPAICAVLEQLPVTARGAAFLEVPVGADVLTVQHPAGDGGRVAAAQTVSPTGPGCTLRSWSTSARRSGPRPRSTSSTGSTPTCGRRRPTPRPGRTWTPRSPWSDTISTTSTPGSRASRPR